MKQVTADAEALVGGVSESARMAPGWANVPTYLCRRESRGDFPGFGHFRKCLAVRAPACYPSRSRVAAMRDPHSITLAEPRLLPGNFIDCRRIEVIR